MPGRRLLRLDRQLLAGLRRSHRRRRQGGRGVPGHRSSTPIDFPLTRLGNTTASETAKVMENTFRATTIALMEEWGRFAETVGVDLFEVVDAIRMRPTHANMRTPGFGVGGYCLTKDPLFAKLAASELWDTPMEFPFSSAAVRTNDDAPLVTLDRVRRLIGGTLGGLADCSCSASATARTSATPATRRRRRSCALRSMPVPRSWRTIRWSAHWDELDRGGRGRHPRPRRLRRRGVRGPPRRVPPHRPRLRGWATPARRSSTGSRAVADQRRLVAGLGCPIASIGRGGERPVTRHAIASRTW